MRTRTLLAAATTAAVSLAVAAPALAHAPVVARTPAPNAKVSKVTSVKVTFGDAVITGLISLTKNGTTVTAKTSGLRSGNRAILQETFAKPLAKGVYQVSWRALADDGHHEAGTWKFTVR
jgi:methionine-rich copper-binding protein CopC